MTSNDIYTVTTDNTMNTWIRNSTPHCQKPDTKIKPQLMFILIEQVNPQKNVSEQPT